MQHKIASLNTIVVPYFINNYKGVVAINGSVGNIVPSVVSPMLAQY